MTRPSEAGAQLQDFLLATQRFHESCAALLRFSDQWLTSPPTRLALGGGAYTMPSSGSSSLSQPRRWITDVLVRIYTVPGHKDVVAWVAALLLAEPERDWPPYDEPLVSAGWLRVKGGEAEPMKLFTVARSFWATKNHRSDGAFATGDPPDYKLPELSDLRVMAVPLGGITNQQDLEAQVLLPLAAELRREDLVP